VVRIHSPRPIHPIQFKSVVCCRDSVILGPFLVTMAGTMATPILAGSLDCGQDRVLLRMDIPFRSRRVAVTSQICKRIRVHASRR
jgi:hypothetical protein